MTADWSFAARGFSVFPLAHHAKTPAIEEWTPYMHAPASPSLVDGWAAQTTLNMGVATGAVSGCIVLDADSLLSRIEAEARGLPRTLTIRTPRGTHFYFAHPGWPVSNRAGDKWAGISGLDLRADGGYVVGPGSYYVPTPAELAKGKVEGAYAVEIDAPLAPAPDWLLELTMAKGPIAPVVAPSSAEETSAYGRAALHGEITKLIECTEGVSNQIYVTVARIAELVAGGEIREDEGWGAIEEALQAKGLGDEAKANGTVHRAWEKGCSNPKAVRHAEPFDLTAALGTRAMVALDDVPPPPVPHLGPQRAGVHVGGNEVHEYFKGVVLVVSRNEAFLPNGKLVTPAKFDSLYGGARFCLDVDGKKVVKGAWEMFTKNEHMLMPRVWDICFRPELEPGATIMLEGLPYLNIYVPIYTPRKAGDPSPFVNHVRKMLPNGEDADILLHWMASAVQNPGKKFFWWPVVQGTKGNGKSLLLDVMIHAIGERYSHMVRADSVIKTGNQFNDWIVGKLFLGFGEIRSSEGKRDFVESMKDTVTDSRVATEGKGTGQTTSDNRANGMMLTNWKDACPIDSDERRFAVFYAAQQRVEDLERDDMGSDYFGPLYDWLRREDGHAIVTHFLANMPLQARLDPAQGAKRAPETSSTAEAITESLGVIEQELQETIESGGMGFRDGVATTGGVKAVLAAMRKTVGAKRFPALMEAVGYVRHPALESNKWRTNTALSDGTRHVLYFAKDHPILSEDDVGIIRDAADQALFPSGSPPSNVVPIRR